MSNKGGENDFLLLIEEFGAYLEEEDLKTFLEAKMELFSRYLLAGVILIPSSAILFVALQPLKTVNLLIFLSLLGVYIMVYIFSALLIIRTLSLNPFKKQRQIMENYLEALEILRRTKVHPDEQTRYV
jgi:hypothetical protein